ncbi:MAG: hypothetical protein CMC14_00680 [Flavobacteriaceae bacterium]|nr:hypothetical protein [Flavobacteriaceae bacterium]
MVDKNLLPIDGTKTVFTCYDSQKKTMFAKMSINQIDSTCSVLILEKSNGFTGEEINIMFDNELKIWNISFYSWTDAIDLDLIKNELIEKSKIVLNKNPFEKGFEDLKGYLELNIRTERRYRGETKNKAYIENTIYNASFKCN